MDIDFHFSTVYVLARWAGFGSDNARLLATCSQLVDDNIDDKMPYFSAFTQRFSGHEIWENVREVENAEVWVPFHFLPALDGDTLDQQLVCRKNSVLAQALAADMRTYSGKDRLFRLGIALHVYADTWAHQEFSGITSVGNTLLGLESQPEQKIGLEWLTRGDLNIARGWMSRARRLLADGPVAHVCVAVEGHRARRQPRDRWHEPHHCSGQAAIDRGGVGELNWRNGDRVFAVVNSCPK